MIKKEIKCDNCEADLSTTTNSIDYRLHLHDEKMASQGGVVTDMMKYPNLKDGDCHFCWLGCLKMWVSKL